LAKEFSQSVESSGKGIVRRIKACILAGLGIGTLLGNATEQTTDPFPPGSTAFSVTAAMRLETRDSFGGRLCRGIVRLDTRGSVGEQLRLDATVLGDAVGDELVLDTTAHDGGYDDVVGVRFEGEPVADRGPRRRHGQPGELCPARWALGVDGPAD